MNNSDQIISILSFALFVTLLFIFSISLAVRYRKRKKENELLKTSYLLEIRNVHLEIKEDILHHVSRELHDNLGQIASLIKINLNTINTTLLPQETEDKIEETRKLMRRLTRDIKILSVGIHKLSPDQSFLEVARNEIAQLNKTGLIAATLLVSNDFVEPQQEKSLMIFRMMQEAINNIIKHSQATALDARFCYRNGASIIELQDNGIGFDINQPTSGDGSGLSNLRHRARLINAELKIASKKAAGTTVTITFT
ncbi:sensor histidine kinase [Taibaiella koreensis]|uniref:sensor histidine kinase n=1 Tax=Taibaiella koreensis TaxID=1268548 RepID=UPI000E59B92C|nr:ATP-binding protein [Taibaiella koreensis]